MVVPLDAPEPADAEPAGVLEPAAVEPELELELQAAMRVTAAAAAAAAVMTRREPARLRTVMVPPGGPLHPWRSQGERCCARKIDRMSVAVNGWKPDETGLISQRYRRCHPTSRDYFCGLGRKPCIPPSTASAVPVVAPASGLAR